MNVVSHGLSISRDAAVWGLRLYLRHFPLIFGLALIPTVQRFVVVNWGDQLPSPVNVGSEILTWVARLALIYLVPVLAIARDPRLRPYSWDERASRAVRFIGANKFAATVPLLVLGAGLVVFKLLPEWAIENWVATADRDMAFAILLAVKNPIIITFTFIWIVGTVRHMMIAGDRRSEPAPASLCAPHARSFHTVSAEPNPASPRTATSAHRRRTRTSHCGRAGRPLGSVPYRPQSACRRQG
ncbi:MAG: hypothetical protein ACRD0P_10800 [Stackebrandtia sp.]